MALQLRATATNTGYAILRRRDAALELAARGSRSLHLEDVGSVTAVLQCLASEPELADAERALLLACASTTLVASSLSAWRDSAPDVESLLRTSAGLACDASTPAATRAAAADVVTAFTGGGVGGAAEWRAACVARCGALPPCVSALRLAADALVGRSSTDRVAALAGARVAVHLLALVGAAAGPGVAPTLLPQLEAAGAHNACASAIAACHDALGVPQLRVAVAAVLPAALAAASRVVGATCAATRATDAAGVVPCTTTGLPTVLARLVVDPQLAHGDERRRWRNSAASTLLLTVASERNGPAAAAALVADGCAVPALARAGLAIDADDDGDRDGDGDGEHECEPSRGSDAADGDAADGAGGPPPLAEADVQFHELVWALLAALPDRAGGAAGGACVQQLLDAGYCVGLATRHATVTPPRTCEHAQPSYAQRRRLEAAALRALAALVNDERVASSLAASGWITGGALRIATAAAGAGGGLGPLQRSVASLPSTPGGRLGGDGGDAGVDVVRMTCLCDALAAACTPAPLASGRPASLLSACCADADAAASAAPPCSFEVLPATLAAACGGDGNGGADAPHTVGVDVGAAAAIRAATRAGLVDAARAFADPGAAPADAPSACACAVAGCAPLLDAVVAAAWAGVTGSEDDGLAAVDPRRRAVLASALRCLTAVVGAAAGAQVAGGAGAASTTVTALSDIYSARARVVDGPRGVAALVSTLLTRAVRDARAGALNPAALAGPAPSASHALAAAAPSAPALALAALAATHAVFVGAGTSAITELVAAGGVGALLDLLDCGPALGPAIRVATAGTAADLVAYGDADGVPAVAHLVAAWRSPVTGRAFAAVAADEWSALSAVDVPGTTATTRTTSRVPAGVDARAKLAPLLPAAERDAHRARVIDQQVAAAAARLRGVGIAVMPGELVWRGLPRQ